MQGYSPVVQHFPLCFLHCISLLSLDGEIIIQRQNLKLEGLFFEDTSELQLNLLHAFLHRTRTVDFVTLKGISSWPESFQ